MMKVRRRKLVEQTKVEQTTTKTIPVLPVPYLIVPRASPMKPAKDLFKDVFIEPATPETTIEIDFINGIAILKKRRKR
jgi:hypothetical protein